MVSDDEVGTSIDATLERLEVRGHTGGDSVDLATTRHLQAVRPVVVEGVGVEEVVAEGEDLVAIGHDYRYLPCRPP
jgi:hypothetical protein